MNIDVIWAFLAADIFVDYTLQPNVALSVNLIPMII